MPDNDILCLALILIFIFLTVTIGYGVEMLRYVIRFRKVHGKEVWKRAFKYIKRG